ncbi:hypothetical protein SKAU_G00118010 [Synaphobranchus kaupii]|uniref:Meteorin-like protein n=1 Tax=Synaphobranchus kaupii TaxID=118154 RepID=A0A9Q1FNL2_SYNKA|nr:hypothetical protein SKAU_G00118010 [Synaphobranchus kaupii]
MLSPFLAYFVAVLLLCRVASSQYSSDQCSWRGSGLTHEAHARDVEQVYLRCSQAAGLLTVCIKPRRTRAAPTSTWRRAATCGCCSASRSRPSAACTASASRRGRCSSRPPLTRTSAARSRPSSTSCSTAGRGLSCTRSRLPVSPVMMQIYSSPVCSSDFAGRGSIQGVEQEPGQSVVAVRLSRLFRQKSRVFSSAGGRGPAMGGTGEDAPPVRGEARGEASSSSPGRTPWWKGSSPRIQCLKIYGRTAAERSLTAPNLPPPPPVTSQPTTLATWQGSDRSAVLYKESVSSANTETEGKEAWHCGVSPYNGAREPETERGEGRGGGPTAGTKALCLAPTRGRCQTNTVPMHPWDPGLQYWDGPLVFPFSSQALNK